MEHVLISLFGYLEILLSDLLLDESKLIPIYSNKKFSQNFCAKMTAKKLIAFPMRNLAQRNPKCEAKVFRSEARYWVLCFN